MYKAFLIKYAEIGVKGKNRDLFEEALVRQIKYALKRCEGEFRVRRTRGRIYIDVLSDDYDYEETIDNLKTVCGVSAISGTRSMAHFPLLIVSSISRIYTEVFPLPVILALHPRLKLLPSAFPGSNHFAECLFGHGGGLLSSQRYCFIQELLSA